MKAQSQTHVATLADYLLVDCRHCGQNCKIKAVEMTPTDVEGRSEIKRLERDARFLLRAAENLVLEIELAQLAQWKGQYDRIIALGKIMKVDYTRILNALSRMAKRKLIPISYSPTTRANKRINKLVEKSDHEFDEAYCLMVVQTQKETISLFEKASTASDDPDIEAWADWTLPVFRKHLDHAVSFLGSNESMKFNLTYINQ